MKKSSKRLGHKKYPKGKKRAGLIECTFCKVKLPSWNLQEHKRWCRIGKAW